MALWHLWIIRLKYDMLFCIMFVLNYFRVSIYIKPKSGSKAGFFVVAAVFQMPGMARTRRVLTILETGTTETVHTEIGHQETDLQERRTPHTLNSTHGIPTTEIGTGILGTVITSLARSAVQDMIVSS